MSHNWIGFKIEDDDGLYRKVDEIHEMLCRMDRTDALLDALQRLYDATPASSEDSALIEAQKLAESLLKGKP